MIEIKSENLARAINEFSEWDGIVIAEWFGIAEGCLLEDFNDDINFKFIECCIFTNNLDTFYIRLYQDFEFNLIIENLMNFIKKLANGNNISIKVIEAEITMEILITDNNDKTILEFIVYESDFIQTFIDAFEKENLEIVYE